MECPECGNWVRVPDTIRYKEGTYPAECYQCGQELVVEVSFTPRVDIYIDDPDVTDQERVTI